jgi:hypothetical protein
MSEQVGAGKVRAIGVSNVTADALAEAAATAEIAVVQNEYSLLAREAEDRAVDSRSPVDSGATAMSLGHCRSIVPEDWLDPLPQLIIDFPNCIKRPVRLLGPSHPCCS